MKLKKELVDNMNACTQLHFSLGTNETKKKLRHYISASVSTYEKN